MPKKDQEEKCCSPESKPKSEHENKKRTEKEKDNNNGDEKQKQQQRFCVQNLSPAQREWLKNLKPELETMTVLYAKSVFGPERQQQRTEIGAGRKQRAFIRVPIL